MIIVILYRIILRLLNGVTSSRRIELATVSLGDGIVEDAKFIDEETLMVIWHDKSGMFQIFLKYIQSTNQLE